LQRCHHHYPSNRRCRSLASGAGAKFCWRHAADADAETDLSAALTGGLQQFTSPGAVNDFLSRLLLLLAENRISPRRAAVLAYITNQILRTIASPNGKTPPPAIRTTTLRLFGICLAQPTSYSRTPSHSRQAQKQHQPPRETVHEKERNVPIRTARRAQSPPARRPGR
jgi:hypothetical protein